MKMLWKGFTRIWLPSEIAYNTHLGSISLVLRREIETPVSQALKRPLRFRLSSHIRGTFENEVNIHE